MGYDLINSARIITANKATKKYKKMTIPTSSEKCEADRAGGG
jgi:hypothetical protein